MALFTVTKIIDGDTIKVSPDWLWNGRQGSIVRIFGYRTPRFPHEQNYVENKLNAIILGKQVELKDAFIPSHFPPEHIACRVFCNSIDISRYFPEFGNF